MPEMLTCECDESVGVSLYECCCLHTKAKTVRKCTNKLSSTCCKLAEEIIKYTNF